MSDELTAYPQEWLAATFTKQIFGRRQTVEPPKFRSIVQAVRASMYVDRITRKQSATPVEISPATRMLQEHLNEWDIDVFKYDGLTGAKPFRGLFAEVLRRYGLVKRFKVRTTEFKIATSFKLQLIFSILLILFLDKPEQP